RPAYIDGPPDDHREDEAEGSELTELRGAAVKGRSPLGRGWRELRIPGGRMPESAPIVPRRPGLGEPGRTGPLVLDGDPARDVIEVVEGRCRPDQARAPSHRRNRLRASARDTTRPSEYARSPRAMPSSTARRR